MIASSLAGIGGTVVLSLAAVFIAVMLIIHRRGGARVAGLLGVCSAIVGIIFPHVIRFIGVGAEAASADSVLAGEQGDPVLSFIIPAAPGLLLGVGIVLVCCAAATPRAAPEYPRRSHSG